MAKMRYSNLQDLKDLFAGLKTKFEPKDPNIVHDAIYVHTDNNFTNAYKNTLDGVATASNVGLVKPDGTTITIDSSGTLSVALPNLENVSY